MLRCVFLLFPAVLLSPEGPRFFLICILPDEDSFKGFFIFLSLSKLFSIIYYV